MRIISLLASATEMIYELGCLDQLVGRSHECDYPNQVLSLPVVSKVQIDTTTSSAQIDAQIKQLAEQAVDGVGLGHARARHDEAGTGHQGGQLVGARAADHLHAEGFQGFFGWRDMPDGLRDQIAADVRAVAPDIPAERLADLGQAVRVGSTADFIAMIEDQRAQTRKVIAEAGMKR